MDIYQKVCNRLQSLGFYDVADEMVVEILHNKVTTDILTKCNIKTIPDTHEVFIIDRICGEFLNTKLANGSLSADTELITSSVSAGDTSVSFHVDSISKNDRLQLIFNELMKAGDFKCLRKMRW